MAFIAPVLVAAGASASTAATVATVASTAATVVGAASSIAGVIQGSRANKQATAESMAAAKYNSQVANYNAQVASNNALQSKYAAQANADRIREDNQRRISTIKSKFAKGNVVTTEGSSLLTALDQAAEGEFSAQNELYAGNLEAAGYTSEAALQRNQSQYHNYQAASAKTAGKIKQGTSLLTGVSSIMKAIS